MYGGLVSIEQLIAADKSRFEIEWTWYGQAKHFIGAANCDFHLATQIGDVIISTVGGYRPFLSYTKQTLLALDIDPEDAYKYQDIGHNRKHETMTFKAKIAECDCCDWEADTSNILDWYDEYNDARSARIGHMEICKKVNEFVRRNSNM